MADITMDMIKDIREKTGAGIADCKKALTDANGDINLAIENLRKAGIAKAEKKAGRAVKEGLVVTKKAGNIAAMVEVLCETDFVSTNEKFSTFANQVADAATKQSGDGCVTEAVQAAESEALVGMIATIGENMQIRRAAKWDITGTVGSYIHGGGRIGVMIEVEGAADDAVLRDICMHIAAFSPAFIVPTDIDADTIRKEKEIAMSLPDLAGKPDQIKEKIVDGKIQKWYSEVCLMKQPWFKESSTSLEKLQPGLKVKRFLRWSVSDEI